MKIRLLHPNLLRGTAGLLLAGWGLIALHTLEHHAHGESMDHAGCEACAFFLAAMEPAEAAIVAAVLVLTADHSPIPARPGDRRIVRRIGRAPPASVPVVA